jgi:hypothetical protein
MAEGLVWMGPPRCGVADADARQKGQSWETFVSWCWQGNRCLGLLKETKGGQPAYGRWAKCGVLSNGRLSSIQTLAPHESDWESPGAEFDHTHHVVKSTALGSHITIAYHRTEALEITTPAGSVK